MKSVVVKTLILGLLFSASASAGGVEDSPFSFTASGGDIDNNGIGVFSLFMNSPSIPVITSLELDIHGLTSEIPADLDIFLIDPFGNTLIIMRDRGDAMSLSGADLTFSDDGAALPDDPNALIPGTDYSPQGIGGFSQYVDGSGGTDAWILVVIDDGGSAGGASLDSFTLSGTFVPEPATLVLMSFGALVLLRRKRR